MSEVDVRAWWCVGGGVSGAGAGAGYDPPETGGVGSVSASRLVVLGAGGACEATSPATTVSVPTPPVSGGWSCRCLRLPPLVPRGYAEATTTRRNQRKPERAMPQGYSATALLRDPGGLVPVRCAHR